MILPPDDFAEELFAKLWAQIELVIITTEFSFGLGMI